MREAPDQPISELALQLILELWGKSLARLEATVDPASSGGFRRAWAKVCNDLADDHPTLDPFAPELSYRDGTLVREVQDLDPDFVNALVAATAYLAQLYRLSPAQLRDIMQGDEPEFMQPQVLEQAGLARLWTMSQR